jgi:tripartite-type tricarboxylate transporter receptor subunit TctC
LAGVPVLGGSDGFAVTRAKAMGRDVEAARKAADGLVEVMGAGRIVVAPAGLPSDVAACLEDRLHRALTEPALTAAADAARRPLDVATGQDAAASIAIAEEALPALQAILEANR